MSSLTFNPDPPLSFRFKVDFFIGGVVPNRLDILFQKVSGLGATIETRTVDEGGQNLYSQLLPKTIQHDNLVLERGVAVASPLVEEFIAAMSNFTFSPSNVMVTLLNEASDAVSSWLFLKAYPVKWSVSDLDATANSVAIETMEFTYQHMQVIRL